MSDLGELGLSSYEAKVYRALLGLGPATAAEISAVSDVPWGRIYDVLNSLNGRDILISHEGGGPTRYAPVDPDEAVEVLLAERERDLAAQREYYEEIAASVSEDLAPVVPTESRFWPAGLGSDVTLSLIDQQFAVAEDLHYTLDVVDGETVFVHVANPFAAGHRLGVVSVTDEEFATRVEQAFEDAWGAARGV